MAESNLPPLETWVAYLLPAKPPLRSSEDTNVSPVPSFSIGTLLSLTYMYLTYLLLLLQPAHTTSPTTYSSSHPHDFAIQGEHEVSGRCRLQYNSLHESGIITWLKYT